MRDIVSKDCFYISDGGKVHFLYQKKEDVYALVGSIREKFGYAGCNSADITELIIPNTINGKELKYISGDTFECMRNLKRIIIEEDNKYFSLIEGGLYTKDMTELIRMSPQFTDSCYRVLDGVEMVCDSSIDNPYIETLILPDGCRIIEEYGITGSTNIKRVFIPKSIEIIGRNNFRDANLTDVYYGGSEKDREHIIDQWGEKMLLDKTEWHYNCKMQDCIS